MDIDRKTELNEGIENEKKENEPKESESNKGDENMAAITNRNFIYQVSTSKDKKEAVVSKEALDSAKKVLNKYKVTKK